MIKKQLYILLFLCSFITVHAEGIDRGIRKTTFIPKGQGGWEVLSRIPSIRMITIVILY